MNVMIITCSPNKEGLTESCAKEARLGIEAGNGSAISVRLNDLVIGQCKACTGGWGPCRDQHECQTGDDFQQVHRLLSEVDGLVFVTPVYFGEVSESARAFLDRLRRCEAFRENRGTLEGKPVLCVAAAGGSGGGTISCLASLEKVFIRVKAERQDYLGVTKANRDYMLPAIRAAAEKMADQLQAGR